MENHTERISRSTSSADIQFKHAKDPQAVRDLWFGLAGLMAILVVARIVAFATLLILKPRHSQDQSKPDRKDEETEIVQQGRVSFCWRIFSALGVSFNLLALRTFVSFGGFSASTGELAIIVTYVATNFLLLFIDSKGARASIWEDRAAHLASSQLPLIVALAGKNNIISFLTGIGHEKLNILHRASSRTCLILLWLHAITRTTQGLPEKFDFTHGWVISGATGLAAFTLAVCFSIRIIRTRVFELFLIVHIFLITIFLLCGYFHAREPGEGSYIWPALLVWAFDRVLRLVRVLWNNRVWSGTKYTQATVSKLSADTVRLTFTRRFSWRAGQHVYITLPSISDYPTQSHPFTIASTPNDIDGCSETPDKEVVLLIRGREGFTKRLLAHASQSATQPPVTALIDGPYGCPPDLRSYSTAILIAGGSGVSYTLPLLLDIVVNARANKTAVRRVVFVWSVRDPGHVNWIYASLSRAIATAPTSLAIDPRIYVTGKNHIIPGVPNLDYSGPAASTPNGEKEKDKKIEPPLYNALRITCGRPSIPKLLQDEVDTALGPVSVDVAGPADLARSVRKVVRSPRISSPIGILRGKPTVSLHVEKFGM